MASSSDEIAAAAEARQKYFSKKPTSSEEELRASGGIAGMCTWRSQTLGWPVTCELERVAAFQARASDIWVITLPRSGTTWTQEIIWSLLRLRSLDTADDETLHEGFPFIELSAPQFSAVDNAAAMSDPRTIKSHLNYEALPDSLKTEKPRIIYVCRNPKDMASSFWHFVKAFGIVEMPDDYTFADWLRSIIAGKALFMPVFPHILDFWKRRDQSNILFLKYEDMIMDFPGAIRQIAAFIDVQLEEGDVERIVDRASFQRMKMSKHANVALSFPGADATDNAQAQAEKFIRKGVIGSWKELFEKEENREAAAEYDAWIRSSLEGTGLDFDYE